MPGAPNQLIWRPTMSQGESEYLFYILFACLSIAIKKNCNRKERRIRNLIYSSTVLFCFEKTTYNIILTPFSLYRSYTDYSADPRGNVDRDSDEEDVAQPEAFSPEYESLPALRPAAPPMYKPTPNYPHGGTCVCV